VSLGALRHRGMQWRWHRRPKTHVRPAMVEMGYPWFQNELQVALIQGNEEIQAFTAQRPAEAFAYGIGDRRLLHLKVTLRRDVSG
jgi:hypothetical protein